MFLLFFSKFVSAFLFMKYLNIWCFTNEESYDKTMLFVSSLNLTKIFYKLRLSLAFFFRLSKIIEIISKFWKIENRIGKKSESKPQGVSEDHAKNLVDLDVYLFYSVLLQSSSVKNYSIFVINLNH